MHACDQSFVCNHIQDALKSLGREPLTECNGQWPCPNTVENARELFHGLTPDKTSVALQLVYALNEGKLPITATKENLSDIPFCCPELEIEVYQPCRVSSCSFHSEGRHWARNCILYFRGRQLFRSSKNEEHLSTKELSILLRKPERIIRASVSRIMKTARKEALKETISQNEAGVVQRIETRDLCYVCENPVDKTVFRRATKYPYCSEQCYIYKPPFVIDIEKEFKLPVRQILEVCIANFRSTKVIAQALGVTKAKLMKLSKRYTVPLPS